MAALYYYYIDSKGTEISFKLTITKIKSKSKFILFSECNDWY